ncbi:hypothetical protein MA16_Dca004850 [Dendrobium catenatum]|uniref:Uncharacterized protein n=1 Tax=Dendrobium catenatum TaxID=906689 RepID=A0A2I0WG89_9ASPA|nr:hypothetical protein MA16_Dca004850 [Dendrobium catenatum]
MNQVVHPSTISKSVEELQIHIILLYPFYIRSLTTLTAKPGLCDIEFMRFGSQ